MPGRCLRRSRLQMVAVCSPASARALTSGSSVNRVRSRTRIMAYPLNPRILVSYSNRMIREKILNLTYSDLLEGGLSSAQVATRIAYLSCVGTITIVYYYLSALVTSRSNFINVDACMLASYSFLSSLKRSLRAHNDAGM